MPWRPTAKSSYLTKNHFQWNFISSPHSNQFTALSSFHFVVNTDRLSSVRTKRSVLRLHQKGNFITSNRGRALWAEFGWAAHASLMLSLSDKNTCMTQVSFLRRWEICRWATCLLQHTYLYVDLDRRSQTSTLLFLHLSSFTKKKHHNLIKEFPRVEYDKWESDSNDFHLLSLQFKYGPEMTAVPGCCSSNCVLSHSSVNSEARLPGPQ